MIKKITVRLEEKDYIKLRIQVDELKKSQNELIRELIRKNYIEDIKEHNLFMKDIFFLYKNISNNLNQIAKKVNINDISNNDIKKGIDEIWQLLKRFEE